MSDNEENQHKTMIKQLTDLDDNALDEQAGLFMHPRRKSLRSETTPRPLSQPFFQPQQVFPDVLNVSAMVERQEQRDLNTPLSKETPEAQSQMQSSTDTPVTAAKALTAGILGPGYGYMQDPQATALLAQYPQGLALQSARTAIPSDVKTSDSTTSVPNASSKDNNNGSTNRGGSSNNIAEQKRQTGLRSVSLTRIAGEHLDSISGRPSSGGEINKRDGAATAGIQSGADTPPMPPSAQHMLRSGTPADTPTEEGDRQLGSDGGRYVRPSTKRPSRRIAGASSSDGRGPPQSRGGRLFSRRTNNPSSRGSDDENNSDDEEQFIYHNSRSSLHVSSIPEENYDDREAAAGGKRRPNRHRMSTHMGGTGSIGGERRDSAGIGRTGGASSNMSTGSYSHAHPSSSTVHGAGNIASTGGSGSGRPSRRLQGRIMRGGAAGGGSVNTVSGGTATSYSGYGYGGTSISANNSGTVSASINNSGSQGHRFSILTHVNNDYGMSSEESDMEDEPAGLRSTFTNNSNMYSRRNSRRFHSNVYYGSSEEMPETTPLFRRHYTNQRKRKSVAAQIVRGALASVLVLGSLFILVALFNYTSAPLVDVEAVKVTNILATEKELLFILHVQATNPNIREVLIERAEIGVFAAAATDNNN
ncbi:hypothetical protein EV175_004851, partial [Coemansia sp. RSA 1933]